jgi:hypothetical protein
MLLHNEMERIFKEAVMGVSLEGLRKTMKNLNLLTEIEVWDFYFHLSVYFVKYQICLEFFK